MNRVSLEGLLAQAFGGYLTGQRNKTHGESGYSRTPEYRSWEAMKYRCLTRTSKHWPLYGGRGITVCKKWMNYENFLTDMGRKPDPTYTIDRINNDKGYYPGNCQWASKKQQANNRRFTERPRNSNGTFKRKVYGN